jgi:hypothetical protein
MEMNLRPVIDYERDGWKESMPLRMKNVVSISAGVKRGLQATVLDSLPILILILFMTVVQVEIANI